MNNQRELIEDWLPKNPHVFFNLDRRPSVEIKIGNSEVLHIVSDPYMPDFKYIYDRWYKVVAKFLGLEFIFEPDRVLIESKFLEANKKKYMLVSREVFKDMKEFYERD